MKKSSKLLTVIFIIISLFIGVIIGIALDYPQPNKAALSGTIGKMSNYRNVKVTDNDIKLRSDLLSNDALLKSYRQFFSFHYTSCVKLCQDIDFTIQASENESLFREDYSMEIENLKQYRQTIEQTRKDLLLAVTTLQQLSTVDENSISMVINNANIAVAQVKYKQNDVLAFVEALEKFLLANNPTLFSDLMKAHDLLAVNQLILAAATNDKPLMKFYNKKQLLSSNEDLKAWSNIQLNDALQSDINSLKADLKDNNQLNIIFDASQIGAVEKQLGVGIPAMEKMGVIIWDCAENLNAIANKENIGLVGNSEKLYRLLNTEKLGLILNSEKLGLFNSEKLGFFDIEKLGIYDSEKLNIII